MNQALSDISPAPDGMAQPGQVHAKRIYFDGLNLAHPRGTGIATYARELQGTAQAIGHETGILHSTTRAPAKNAHVREMEFFDTLAMRHVPPLERRLAYLHDHLMHRFAARPTRLELDSLVVMPDGSNPGGAAVRHYVSRFLFGYAKFRFKASGTFLPIQFDRPPDIMHFTYQMPLFARSACNIWTIHDLVPLRLPYTTHDDKAAMYRLLRKVAAKADHIVTVSEHSRRDIIKYLGVEESRVTNTYQSVSFPQGDLARSDEDVAEELSGSLGLDHRSYLLFFGALEPKKNIARLLDAYYASGVDLPLVLVMGKGWGNERENQMLDEQRGREEEARRLGKPLKRRVIRFEYASRSMLMTLIRGARCVLFPSLYEGFGLPVLEAMMLGTPAITANTSSLPEVAGDAAIQVDPYDIFAIAKAIRQVASDNDLCAEMIALGRVQAEQFSPQRYRGRIERLYAAVG